MICDAVLGKVIGADFFAAVARADKFAPSIGQFFLRTFDFFLQQAGAQHAKGLFAVFYLAFFVLLGDYNTGRQVGNTNSRVGGVNALSTGPAAAKNVNFKLGWLNFDVRFFGLGQNGDRYSTGMDTAGAFGYGNALDTMDASLKFEHFVGVFTTYHKDYFFKTAALC